MFGELQHNSVTELNVAAALWRRNAANAHLAAQNTRNRPRPRRLLSDPAIMVEMDTYRDFHPLHIQNQNSSRRPTRRSRGRPAEDFVSHFFGKILQAVFRTVHLTMRINVVQLEHDLLTFLGLGSALNECTCARD